MKFGKKEKKIYGMSSKELSRLNKGYGRYKGKTVYSGQTRKYTYYVAASSKSAAKRKLRMPTVKLKRLVRFSALEPPEMEVVVRGRGIGKFKE